MIGYDRQFATIWSGRNSDRSEESQAQWVDISRSASSGSFFHGEQNLLQRISSQKSFLAVMQAKMHPGMVMALTDAPLHPDSRSGQDFVVTSAAD